MGHHDTIAVFNEMEGCGGAKEAGGFLTLVDGDGGSPTFAEGELLGGVLSKNISVSNENMRGNLCCAWRSSIY
jgi:hypothetical protein